MLARRARIPERSRPILLPGRRDGAAQQTTPLHPSCRNHFRVRSGDRGSRAPSQLQSPSVLRRRARVQFAAGGRDTGGRWKDGEEESRGDEGSTETLGRRREPGTCSAEGSACQGRRSRRYLCWHRREKRERPRRARGNLRGPLAARVPRCAIQPQALQRPRNERWGHPGASYLRYLAPYLLTGR